MSLSFDRVAGEYDATRGGEDRGAHIAADLAPRLTGGGRVLDVGRAWSRWRCSRTAMMSSASTSREPCCNGHATGSDAASRSPTSPSCPSLDETFADAFAVWVMHAVGDHARVLREVARVLRPGGRFLVCSNRLPEPHPISEIVAPMLQALRPAGDVRHDRWSWPAWPRRAASSPMAPS